MKAESRHQRFLASLNGHAPIDKEGSVRVFTARLALKKFEKQSEIWGDAKVRFAENDEMANVQNRVWADVEDSELVVMEDFAEERVTWGAETPGHVLKEDNDFT